MARLWQIALRYRARWLLGCLLLVVTASLAMTIPLLLRAAVDIMAATEPDPGARSVGFYAACIIAIALVQGVSRAFSRFLIFNTGRDVEYDLRNDLFRHLETLPPAFYKERTTGDLMSRLINDISAVRLMLGPGLLNVINTPIYYIYALTIMLSIDPTLTLAALAPYPLAMIYIKGTTRKLMVGQIRVQEGLSNITGAIQEHVSGIHVVKAYAMESREEARFAKENTDFREASLELARLRGMIAPVTRLVSGSGILIVLWLGGSRVAAGTLQLGDLVAFMGYLHLLAWPTMALGWMLSIVQRGRASMMRLEELLDESSPLRAKAGPHGLEPLQVGAGEIEFRDVGFAYPDAPDEKILDGINLRIPAGTTVALVGRSGSGKSSFLQLLPRLFDPDAGEVRIDGHDIRSYALGDLRRAIAFVPQDPFLFSTSIATNIAFADPELDAGSEGEVDVRIREAAQWAALDGDVESFPHGYATMVGERGITLSGGQKQRVTLARALLHDAPILVLDDALSSVDTHTEERVLQALEHRRAGRTCLIVAHRLSTVQDADMIVVFDAGRIVASGRHRELLQDCVLYGDLFRRQMLEDELEAR
ncbi:MAG: ABC transporter ATP-binding protein [Deltaproteobacteria bacterium]